MMGCWIYLIHADGNKYKLYLEKVGGGLEEQTLTASELATVLKNNLPTTPATVRLLSCSSLESAHDLARALDRPVVATAGKVDVYESSNIGSSTENWYLLEKNKTPQELQASNNLKPNPPTQADKVGKRFVRMGNDLDESDLEALITTNPDEAFNYLVKLISKNKTFNKLEYFEKEAFDKLKGKIGQVKLDNPPIQVITNKYPNESILDECSDGKIYGICVIKPDGKIVLNTNLNPNFSTDVNFIITLDNKLIIGNKHHLLSFRNNVQSAGSLKITNGKIKRINNLSGHFKPTISESEKYINVFENLGIDIKDALLEIYELQDFNGNMLIHLAKTIKVK